MSKIGTGRKYDEKFKVEAVKIAKEIGTKQAAEELGIPKGTLGGWLKKEREGKIDTGSGIRKPEESLSLVQQLWEARRQLKEQEKEIKRLKELNEFLEEASSFFAASRQKYAKKKE
ncbi:MAG: transposase [Ruminococcus sp.]|nr:transposase [Ruminococcus sp.]